LGRVFGKKKHLWELGLLVVSFGSIKLVACFLSEKYDLDVVILFSKYHIHREDI
jgi:hypothetical protein